MAKTSFYENAIPNTVTTPPAPPAQPAPTNPSHARSSFYENSGVVYPASGEASANLDISIAIPGAAFLANEWLFGYSFDVPVYIPANFVGSAAVARVASTAPSTLSFQKNGVQFGTLSFSGTTGFFACPQTAFAQGDVLELVAPAAPDATLAHLAITLFAPRL